MINKIHRIMFNILMVNLISLCKIVKIIDRIPLSCNKLPANTVYLAKCFILHYSSQLLT